MKNSIKTISLSLLVMALWGSLFPMVKLGYSALSISAKSVPDILMFASYRFIISGLAVSVFCLFKKEKIATPKGKSILNIVIM
ncbi:MAG: EamA family transporter, partial [Clostridia bacterium]|nr:EamA family transporter [Clostridia bacterium]